MAAHRTNGADRGDLSGRVDTIGWGVLFLVLGGVGLIPGLPKDSWLIAAGLVMVGVSATRAALGVPVSGLTTLIGLVAIVAGVGSVAGLASATGPLVLIVLGLALVAGALVRTERGTDVASPSAGM